MVFITIVMIPNIVFAIRCKDGFADNYRNKTVELVEQIDRFSCFGFMVFNVQHFWFGWATNEAFALYLASAVKEENIKDHIGRIEIPGIDHNSGYLHL